MSKSYLKADHLRVCIVAFMFWPLVGGAEAQAEKHARQLQALGNYVMVLHCVTASNGNGQRPLTASLLSA